MQIANTLSLLKATSHPRPKHNYSSFIHATTNTHSTSIPAPSQSHLPEFPLAHLGSGQTVLISVGIRGHMGHIGILVVVVRRLSRRWKVKTLMRRRLPTPLFPTISLLSNLDARPTSLQGLVPLPPLATLPPAGPIRRCLTQWLVFNT